jgi:hypothetical protein
MRNLLMTLVLCGVAQFAAASTGCPATVVAQPETPPAAELISSAAAQAPLGTAASQRAPMMVAASVHASGTQVMGGPPNAAITESPRRGSRLAMVLAALGVMLVIVLRRIGASD